MAAALVDEVDVEAPGCVSGSGWAAREVKVVEGTSIVEPRVKCSMQRGQEGEGWCSVVRITPSSGLSLSEDGQDEEEPSMERGGGEGGRSREREGEGEGEEVA